MTRREPAGPAVDGALDAAMGRALEEAMLAADAGEVPVGALVLAPDGSVLSVAHNTRERDPDPTAHAEILALRAACRARGERMLPECTLVVTLEPCVMCAGAIVAARIPRVVFGAWDDKAGAVGSVYDVLRDRRLPHPPVEVIAGVREAECAAVLAAFFADRRSAESLGTSNTSERAAALP